MIIFHNQEAKESRDFISSLPLNHGFTIIDYYKDPDSLWSYIGPPISAFPTVIDIAGTNLLGTHRMPTTWNSIKDRLQDPTIMETIEDKDGRIAGRTLEDIEEFLVSGEVTVKQMVLIQRSLNTIERDLTQRVNAIPNTTPAERQAVTNQTTTSTKLRSLQDLETKKRQP